MMHFWKTGALFLSNLVKYVFVYIAYFLFLIAATPLFSSAALLRFVIRKTAKCRFGWEILSGLGAAAGAEDLYGHQALTVQIVFTLAKNVNIDQLREVIKRVWIQPLNGKEPKNPLLLCCLQRWMGYAFWKPVKVEDFDISRHVVEIDYRALPIPEKSPRQVTDAVSEYVMNTRVWQEGHPLWELLVVSNVPNEEGNGALGFFRWHHACFDGFAAGILLAEITEKVEVDQPKMTSRLLQLEADHRNLCHKSVEVVKTIVAYLFAILVYPLNLESFLTSFYFSPCRQRNGCRLVTSEKIDLSLVKQVKSLHTNASVSSVMMSILAGGIRDNFLNNGKESFPWIKKMSSKSPSLNMAISFVMPSHKGSLSFDTTGITFPLPLREPDGHKRLNFLSDSLRWATQARLMLIFFAAMEAFSFLPIVVVERLRWLQSPVLFCPFVLSNIIAGEEEGTFLGARVLDYRASMNVTAPFMPEHFFIAISYMGKVRVTSSGVETYTTWKGEEKTMPEALVTRLFQVAQDELVNQSQIQSRAKKE